MATGAALAPPSLPFPSHQRQRSVSGQGVAFRGRLKVAACMQEVAGGSKKAGFVTLPSSNYVVPLDKVALGITRPMGEILRDLNKKVADNIVNKTDRSIPW